MAEVETQIDRVLTLTEAAAFLRVNEAALADKAAAGEVPAQQIGSEWRFLQRALVDWLYAAGGTNGAPLRRIRLKRSSLEGHRHL